MSHEMTHSVIYISMQIEGLRLLLCYDAGNPSAITFLDVRCQESVDKCMDLVRAELYQRDLKLIGLVNNAGIGMCKHQLRCAPLLKITARDKGMT